jgi:hypothetical protein
MKICTLQTQLATKTTNPQEPSSLTKSQPTSPAALHTIKTTKTLHDSPTMKTFSTIFLFNLISLPRILLLIQYTRKQKQKQ